MFNLVTIIADASFCPDSKMAGYGSFVASDRGKRYFNGALPNTTDNNTAEIMVIVNALWHGLQNNLIEEGSTLLIQTDSVTAIRTFKGEVKTKNNQQTKAYRTLWDYSDRFKLKLTFRHLPGHSCGADKRSKVQISCDRAAKIHMQRARAEFMQAGYQIDVQRDTMRKQSRYLRMNKVQRNV